MSRRYFCAFSLFLVLCLGRAPAAFAQTVISLREINVEVRTDDALKLRDKALAAEPKTGSVARPSPPAGKRPATKKVIAVNNKRTSPRAGKGSAVPGPVSTDGAKPAEGAQPEPKASAGGQTKPGGQPGQQSYAGEGGGRKLSKEEVRSLAEELGLLAKPRVNPLLAMNDDDISGVLRRQPDERDVRLELAARKAVLDAADEHGVVISDRATLSRAVTQVMVFMIPRGEGVSQTAGGIKVNDPANLICEGDTSEEFIKKAWAALNESKAALNERRSEDVAKSYDKALACAKEVIDKWGGDADEQEAARLKSGECKTTPDARERDAFFKSNWALSDVSAAWFIRGQVYGQQKKWPEAKSAYKFIINNYPCAYLWDPRGWFWRTAAGAESELKKIEASL